jgi:hypothetical protein
MYYPDNSLTKGTEAMQLMVKNFELKKGYFSASALQEIRKAVIDWITPRYASGLWKDAVDSVMGAVAPSGKPSAIGAAIAVVAPSGNPSAVAAPSVPSGPSATSTMKVCFTDMWDDFNPQYNFFTLLLQESVNNI